MHLGIFFPSLPFCRSQTLFVPELTLGLLRGMRPVLGSQVWDKFQFFLKHLPCGQETAAPTEAQVFSNEYLGKLPPAVLSFLGEKQWSHPLIFFMYFWWWHLLLLRFPLLFPITGQIVAHIQHSGDLQNCCHFTHFYLLGVGWCLFYTVCIFVLLCSPNRPQTCSNSASAPSTEIQINIGHQTCPLLRV